MAYEVRKNGYLVSTDRSSLDIEAIHDFLCNHSYWANGVPRAQLVAAIERSIPFGAYEDGLQIGFARVVTDGMALAYLADVYVEEPHRGRGVATLLLEAVLAHPELQQHKRWLLGTRDAHSLYAQSGFVPLETPERWMERAPAGAPR